ncbi:hypothetical protein [Actinophytocola sp.]|uniref:hypothetical protein n=1 Tax=Actinophytocola sp. TaxID=1872138 RepID=UPI002D7F5D57|nr:hypothetical protein [Actinophytocola sp.]HET9138405.1 hypothetical protein [Actinophytocola sp.]
MTDGPNWASPDQQPGPQPAAAAPPPPGWQTPPSPPKPGVIPLRPLGLGEILDGAVSTMRRHPKLTLGISAIVVTVSQLLILAGTYWLLDDIAAAATIDENTPTDEVFALLGKSLTVIGITLVVTLLFRVFLAGFLTIVVGKAVLGQPISFAEEWEQVRPRLLPLLGLTLVIPAIVFGAAVLVALLVVMIPPVGILLFIAAIPVAIWLFVLFSLATPALMLEHATVGRAFGRSRLLVRGSWWRIFGITVLASLLATVVALIINIPFNLIAGNNITLAAVTLTTVGAIISSTVTEPFAAGVNVLLYTDQRIRREGMDIELARAAAG